MQTKHVLLLYKLIPQRCITFIQPIHESVGAFYMAWYWATCRLLSSRRGRAGWGHEVTCRRRAGLLGPAQCLCPWADSIQGFPAWRARHGRKRALAAAGMLEVPELLGVYPVLCRWAAPGASLDFAPSWVFRGLCCPLVQLTMPAEFLCTYRKGQAISAWPEGNLVRGFTSRSFLQPFRSPVFIFNININ